MTTTTELARRALRTMFSTGGVVAPRVAAKAAERLFYSPRRHQTPARERGYLDSAERFYVDTRQGRLSGWTWGDQSFPWERPQETVLLVHGWEGRGSQLGAFAAPLVERGFRVVAYDGPAHGSSPGTATDLPTVAQCIGDVARATGPVRAVIAHSMGAAAAAIALADDAPIERAVLLAPPCSIFEVTEKFAAEVGLPQQALDVFRANFERRFGADVWQRFAGDVVAPRTHAAALIVHDDEDREVDVDEGVRLAAAWPGARLLRTRGLGHRRVLREQQIVDEVVRFVAGDDVSVRRAA